MVKIAGAANGPSALRPLNAPQPIRVKTMPNGRPLLLVLGRKRLRVASVTDVWRVTDEWWRDNQVSRTYFETVVEDGRRLTLFLNDATEEWYVQRYA